jgi:hypothetical protein
MAPVHHLVSVVTGELAEDQDAITLLRACFPGGSITGAPKIRAMEIIAEIEGWRREVYCGAIGFIGFNGNMDANIAIRTATIRNATAIFHTPAASLPRCRNQRPNTRRCSPRPNAFSMHSMTRRLIDHACHHRQL